MGILNTISETFWSTDVWLPPNTTWADIAPGSRPDVQHTDYRHLVWPLPMAVAMLFIRHCLEKYWFAPVGRSLGIRSTRPKPPPLCAPLDAAYNQCTRLSHKTVVALSKQTDLSERQVERWWRRRRAQDKPTTLVKFCENSFRCVYYTYSFIFGIVVLWDKPWLWNIKECWYSYPHQSISNDVWWYYMISMAFYWSLMASQFFDVRRKDFWQMFIHHIITIALIAFSWICNLHRVGSLVLVVHDCADIFLEAAKLTKYAQYQKICDAIFAIFILVWVVTRLGMYPRIIYSSSYEATKILPMFPAYYIFNSLLLLLLVLHIGWTYLIFQIARQALRAGQMDGDVRSSSDEISDSSVDNPATAATANGNGKHLANTQQTNGTPKREANGNAKATSLQSDNPTPLTAQ
ncbi:ceramide synthase 6 [Culicoides brevitarsis]|uniref:ceramide synthase 6 n=1 Tax=Culicoides brevitarsis TaxID=469753 RepID=UPI00307BC065